MSINDTYPHTYRGYNEKGEILCGIPAQNANSQIDPSAIKSAIEAAKEIIKSSTTSLTKNISDLEEKYSEAVQMEGVTGFDCVDDLKKNINNVSKITDSFDELASAAKKKHDELQVKYNTEAHSSAAGCSGVTEIREI